MLPALPENPFVLVEERRADPDDTSAFLRLRRQVLRVRLPGGELSEPFGYDLVDRDRLDATVIAAHYRDARGVRCVYLRSALRPPLVARAPEQRPVPELPTLGALWELPAGLVERDETSAEGLRRCAAREAQEELGFALDPADLAPLGRSTFPAPGVIGERHFYFHVEVDPAKRGEPEEDGSVLERRALVVALPLEEALEAARRGEIEDAKTELALRRLSEVV